MSDEYDEVSDDFVMVEEPSCLEKLKEIEKGEDAKFRGGVMGLGKKYVYNNLEDFRQLCINNPSITPYTLFNTRRSELINPKFIDEFINFKAIERELKKMEKTNLYLRFYEPLKDAMKRRFRKINTSLDKACQDEEITKSNAPQLVSDMEDADIAERIARLKSSSGGRKTRRILKNKKTKRKYNKRKLKNKSKKQYLKK